MNLYVDRALPVPIGVQLRGLIEYGIACGDLAVGERLPSVREMADEIGVAPMTVSQVYRDMKAAGLIETRAGSGTFVADSMNRGPAESRAISELRLRIDVLIEDALGLGLRPSDLVSQLSSRLHLRLARGRAARVVLVGTFESATSRYARLIGSHLGPSVAVETTTVDVLQADAAMRERAATADLVVTFAHRLHEVQDLLPSTLVTAISFIPSEETRLALASINPLSRLGIISRFPEFLPVIKHGIQRFAPHVARVDAAVLDSPETERILAQSESIVFSTGCEAILDRLDPAIPTIEYRHVPDPVDIERVIVPHLRKPRPARQIITREAS